MVVDHDGNVIDTAFEADTDGRWYEEYVRSEKTGRVVVINGGFLTRRIENAVFDLVSRDTGEVLAESR